MKIILIILFIFPGFIRLNAQIDTSSTPLQSSNPLIGDFSKGKVITGDYNRIDVIDLKVYRHRVYFRDKRTKQEQSMLLDSVRLITAKVGSFWMEGTVLGAIGGLILPLRFHSNNEFPNSDVFLYSTAIGAGLGILIGLMFDNYDTIYQNGTLFISYLQKKCNINNFDFNSISLININLNI